MRSICIISLLRIVWAHRLDHDVTYNWAVLYLFSLLEPLLGITVACLPLIQPVVNKISLSSVMSWSKCKLKSTWGSLKSTSQESPESHSVARNWKSLRHPAEHMHGVDGIANSNGGIETHSLDNLEAQDDLTPINRLSGSHKIQVTSIWDVRSSPTK